MSRVGRPRKRLERQRQFENPVTGGWITHSQSMANCARSVLILSLEDRHRPVSQSSRTHYSDHALGAISNVVSAVDAWLNETVWGLGFANRDMLQLTTMGLVERYQALEEQTSGRSFQPLEDLTLLVDARHEIDHFLPRTVDTPHGMPDWLAALAG